MTIGDGLTTTYHLNRLAGTIVGGVPQYDTAGAAIIWAKNITGKKFNAGIDALNEIYAYRNGGKNYHWDVPGVLSMLATGTMGYGEDESARRIVS